VSYAVEWIPGAAFLGTVLLLLLVPPVALIGLMVVALAAVVALVALAGAMLAMPYLLLRSYVGAAPSGAGQRKARYRSPRSLPRRGGPPSGPALQPSPTQRRQGDPSESVGPTRGRRRGRRLLPE
jgi:hypothetical protein